MLKFVMLKCENPSITAKSYAATYYQTLQEVHLPLSLEKPKYEQKIAKICDEKNANHSMDNKKF